MLFAFFILLRFPDSFLFSQGLAWLTKEFHHVQSDLRCISDVSNHIMDNVIMNS